MRKYILISLAFVFILLNFNINTTSAANCAPGELFDSTTGQLCSTTSAVVECPTGDLFSAITGERCNSWITGVTPQFQIGTRGESVRAFQQILKDTGFLVYGKVDGIYGPITAEAAARYYKQYPSITVLSPGNNEVWGKGTNQIIKWSAPSSITTVSIIIAKLYYCNAPAGASCISLYSTEALNIQNVDNDGAYEWYVPTTFSEGGYTIEINDSVNLVAGSSELRFTIK